MCQADGYLDCKADLEVDCEVACEAPEGALFCEGQYVDHGDNLANCIEALQQGFEAEVEGYAEAEAEGEASAEASCAYAPGLAGRGSGALLSLLGLAGAFVARRRRSFR
jgi:MYXO-CTERM domain-containing protein